MPEEWLTPKLYKPSEPGSDPYTPKLPRLGLDTNVVMDAIFGDEPTARALLMAGREGRLELAVSKTFDDEFQPRIGRNGFDPTKDDLWPYVAGLPRLSRLSAVVDHGRIGEMVIGNDGAFGAIHANQSGKERDHSLRDEEHVSSAFNWGAVAFITSERRLLSSEAFRARGWKLAMPADVLAELASIA